MRGLEARVLLAKARIRLISDAAQAGVLMVAVNQQAQADGWNDAASGIGTPPAMFDGEPDLMRAWQYGQDRHCQGFDLAAWRAQCVLLAAQANTCCGLSYDLFGARFSAAVEASLHQMADADCVAAFDIAREFGYETPSQRRETRRSYAEDDSCQHGITRGYCPAGCGSGPDD